MRYFLLSWCNEGFECIQDITDQHPDNWSKLQVMEALKGNTPPPNPLNTQLNHMNLRARMNSHRDYEIYVQHADDSISEQDLVEWSTRDPQGLADWVREHHYAPILRHSSNAARKIIS